MLKTFTLEVEEGAEAAFHSAIAALKSGAHIVEAFLVTETQKLVAEAKSLPIGTTAMNIVSALESHTATGEEKMEMLIAAVTPALAKLKAGGSLSSMVTPIEDFTIEFCQSAYNDFRAVIQHQVLNLEQGLASEAAAPTSVPAA